MAVKNKKRHLQQLGGKLKSNISQNGNSDVKERKERNIRKKHSRVSDDEEFEIASSHIAPSSEVGVDSGGDSDNGDNTKELVQKQNRKHKKSGGFQSMGLSSNTFRGIMKKGYKVPTPIQRKTIPLILDGRDLVAMARTGSGKTAAFVVPMLERLKNHAPTGVRALIMSPTRELALQTFKFIKELGKFTSLKAAVILGGDRIEDQFATIHENPDVVVATPGRFMHVVVEMNLKLQSVEYVVFDEADRLFELGFQEQLSEILRRLPESRQTLLFSATLPKLLVEFAKAGLNNPTLVRLDVDTKLSEHLKMSYLLCRSEDKTAVLLSVLRTVLKPKQQAIVFVATRHHVEYLNTILTEAGYTCSYSYSALDPVARKQNISRFRDKQTSLLLVTDLAARGIDVPMLDHVVNYNFPAKAKLFLHRVGRVARAGREGAAISLVAPDELPYLLDLHLFLGTPLGTVTMTSVPGNEGGDKLLGRVPQHLIDSEEDSLRAWHEDTDVASMKKVVANAYKQYAKSRPNPSAESVKRVKAMDQNSLGYHPLFTVTDSGVESQRLQLLHNLKSYKPGATILEVNSTKRVQSASVMRATRGYNETSVQAHHAAAAATAAGVAGAVAQKRRRDEEEDDDGGGWGEGGGLSAAKRSKQQQQQPTGAGANFGRDDDYYVHYRPRDFNTERGLSLASSFDQQASSAQLDLTGDDSSTKAKFKGNQVWDRKKKKFVSAHGLEQKQKKVKTESGAWVNASYKKNLYEEWKKRSKQEEQEADSGDADSDADRGQGYGGREGRHNKFQNGRHGKRKHGSRDSSSNHGNQRADAGKKRRPGSELHSKEKILKGRRQQWKKQALDKARGNKKQNKSKQRRGRT